MERDADDKQHAEMALGEAHYRDLLLQLQNEFEHAVHAFEQQIGFLTQHNALLEQARTHQDALLEHYQKELDASHKAGFASDAKCRVLEETLQMQLRDTDAQLLRMAEQKDALFHECDALKSLYRQEQRYWHEYQQAKEDEVRSLAEQVAQRDELLEEKEAYCARLHHEVDALHGRVEAAVNTSREFELRLQSYSQQKGEEVNELQRQLRRYKRKLEEKVEQNKYLTEALMERQSQPSKRVDHVNHKPAFARKHVPTPEKPPYHRNHDRLRRRDLDQITTPSTDRYHRKRTTDLDSHAPTSPTSSYRGGTPPITPEKFASPTQPLPNPVRPRDPRTRVERELIDLREKLAACMTPVDIDT